MFIFRKNGHFYERIGKKGEPVCIDDEIPFDIPNTWEWVRINTIREVYTGNSINKTEKETKFTDLTEGYNYIATKDVKFDNSIDYNNGVKIPKDLEKFRVASECSVLLCIEGGSAGRKIGILNQDVCFGNKLACFKTFNENNIFLFYYLQSPNFKEIFKSKKTGIIGGVGIAKLRNVLMPIPPFNEQKRIINKLQNIFPKIEEYGFYEEKLDKLNSEFPDKLKSSILQEAIQGKLVPQDSNDEPASVLLEKIRNEKERLIKEKKIKRNKNESFIYKKNNHYYEKIGKKSEPVCIDDKIPFEVPENWQWCKLENIVKILGDGIHGTPNYDDEGEYYFINGNNLNNGHIIIKENTKKVNHDEYLKHKRDLNENTVLVSINGTIGNVAFYNGEKVMLGKSACYFNLFDNIFKKYLKLLVETDYFMKYALNSATGTTIKNVSLNAMKNWLIPIPPFNEQKEIVKKIENIIQIIYS